MNLIKLVKHAMVFRDLKNSTDCERGQVGAAIYDKIGMGLSAGKNRLPISLAPCVCNDGVDTLKQGSQTCKSVHAEIVALMALKENFNKAYTIATTRPPCKACLSVLLDSPIQMLITTDEYEDRDNSKPYWESTGRRWKVVPMKCLTF